MIPVSKAISLIEQSVMPLGVEQVSITDVVGRILAEDIIADMDVPPFDRSQMDGFAVRAEDVANSPVTLEIVGESAAGHGWDGTMRTGGAVRIMTGARVPKGADCVQKVELTSEADFGSEAAQRTNGNVTINQPIEANKNIVRQGDEVRKGETIFTPGVRVNERMVAALAAFGYSNIAVTKRPRVAILTTGSEVVEIDKMPDIDQIRNSNSAMLEALVHASGGKSTLLPSAPDDLEAIKYVISDAAAIADIVVVTGGVSVGKYDLTKTALKELGAEIFFEKVRLKPGKPAVFARLGKTIVFGLPGNPVSAAVTFYLFVRKALLMMQNAADTEMRKGRAIADGVLKAAKERDTYLPVRLSFEQHIIATPVKWIGSSDFIGFGKADALAFVPGSDHIESGSLVDIFFL